MKSKSAHKPQSIATFISSLANLVSFSPLLTPLLTVDTTSIKTLNEIYQETEGVSSKEGQFLHEVSSRLLSTLDKIYEHHTEMESQSDQLRLGVNLRRKRRQRKQPFDLMKARRQANYEKKQKYDRSEVANSYENDQNVDLSNFQPTNNHSKSHLRPVNLQIKEIIRPEYRRNLLKKHNIQVDQSFQEENNPTNLRGHISHHLDNKQESSKSIPILTNRNQEQRKNKEVTPTKSKRSVSPKIQGRRQSCKIQLNNISAISKKVQTDSSQSLDLDLNYLTTFPEAVDPFSVPKQEEGTNYQYQSIKSISSQNSQQNDKRLSKNVVQVRQKTGSGQIQEEQPWQCDEEEIEEQLRQINERLSYRCYNTQKVQLNYQQQVSQILVDERKSPRVIEFKNKEPKKVRLSLTPTKNKTSPYRSKVERVKVIQVSPPVKQHNQEIKCQKWKKPQKGHIVVDIQRYLSRE